ncbi:MAG TPA: dTMP kinase [Phycisphaerales bacterium]|nr:dTMP kinase [Phycisphaerales bacterium]
MINKTGQFIVLDGPDGCGKSTQTRLLAEWITGQGWEVVSYRDPGTTAIGEKIREILLDPSHTAMTDTVEVLLYMAARAQLWAEHIGPDLEHGRFVVMDRWLSSTCAYQGYAGGVGVQKVLAVAEAALERVWPDVTIILDVDVETARQRMNRDLDRMEQKGADYHTRVREGFLAMQKHCPNAAVIDARASVERVHQGVCEYLKAVLGWQNV